MTYLLDIRIKNSLYPIKVIVIFSLFIAFSLGAGCRNVNKENNVDFTFFIGSDLHFGQHDNDSTVIINKAMAKDMALLPGTEYPDTPLKVASPEWVAFTGDISDHAKKEEWNHFTSIFGLNGEGDFPFLVYEGFGNHDGPTETNPQSYIRNCIKERNLKRKGIESISDNGLHYSWNREGIHFLNLNSYPSNEWDSECGWCHYFHNGSREAAFSLDFLMKYLKESVGDSGKPVILSFHYGLTGWSNEWWTPKVQELVKIMHWHI